MEKPDKFYGKPYMAKVLAPRIIKRCANKLADGTVCNREFVANSASTKYCEECRKEKPWYGMHVKML